MVLLLIERAEQAVDLWIAYCKQQQQELPGLLDEAYDNLAMDSEKAASLIADALRKPTVEQRIPTLQSALAVYKRSKAFAFYSKATEEQILLFNFQLSLEAEMRGQRFVDLPLADTMARLILLEQEGRALEAKKRFNVSDVRYHWIKIRALAEAHKWEELAQFSLKKSPIGYYVRISEFVALALALLLTPNASSVSCMISSLLRKCA